MNKGIAQLKEDEILRCEEKFKQGNLKLQELEKERVWLRNKSALMEAEVKKLENEIKKDFLDKKVRVPKQGAQDPSDRLENYQCEWISLMSFLGPQITM